MKKQKPSPEIIRCSADLDRLTAGLRDERRDSEREARLFLRRMASKGSADIIRSVFEAFSRWLHH